MLHCLSGRLLLFLVAITILASPARAQNPPPPPQGGGAGTQSQPCEVDCIWITPDGGTVTHPPTQSGLQYAFNVYNASEVDDFVAFSCQVTGAVTGCSPSPATATVPYGTSIQVVVTFSTGNPGGGRVTLSGFGEVGSDQGYVDMNVAIPNTSPGVALTPYSGSAKDLAKCVAACFDQVMTFATPAYVSLNAPRSFGLTYSSATAEPTPVIEVDVTPPASGTVTRYELEVRRASDNVLLNLLNGQTSVSYAPRTGSNRLTAAFSAVANGLPGVGAIDVRITVTAHLTSGGPTSTTLTAPLIIVNRQSSIYGVGVWPSGMQQYAATPIGALIVESDGSYFLFRNGTARPGGTTTTFSGTRRTYLDGAYVDFDGSSGMMLRAVDAFGNTTTYHWTTSRLDSITDPMGHRMRMTYDGGTGRITGVTYPASRSTTFLHDGSGRLTRVTDPDTRYTQLGYTGNLVTSQTARSSVTWDYTYDALNRLASAQAPAIPLHDGTTQRPAGTLQSHLVVAWQPGIAGTSGSPKAAVNPDTLRATVTDPLGVATRFKVGKFMAATQIDEPLARVTTITRDTMGRATRVVTPSGHDTRYTWGDGINPPSEPVSALLLWQEQDINRNRTVTYRYGSNNRVIEILGDVVNQKFTYHGGGAQGPAGALKARYIGGSVKALDSLLYDSRGRLTVRIYGDSLRRDSTFYDSFWGNLERSKNARGLVTRYHFDGAGRTDSVYAPDHLTQAYASTAYGPLNEVTSTRNALGHVTSYVYNYDGTLQSVTDPKSQVYNFGYNALGALLAQKDLANPAIADSVFYDLAGQARRMKTRRGSVVQNTYDVLGRLTHQIGTLGADTAIRQFSYDSVGRRIVGWTSEIRDSLLLDPMGRVTNAYTRFGAGPLWRFDYTYNKEDQRIFRVLYRDGGSAGFGGASASYDGFGSLMSLTEGGVNVAFTRTNVSRLPTKQTFTPSAGGGTAWWMGTVFDTLQRMPVRDSFSVAGLNTYFSDRATRDSLDRLRTLFVGDTTVGGGYAFRYDRAGRLLTACVHPTMSTQYCIDEYGQYDYPWAPIDAYAYDLAGNRTDPSVGTVVVGSGNRTTQFGAATYSYNASGQVATKWDGGTFWTYVWSPLDELRGATATGVSVTYAYDAFGRRIKRTYNGVTEFYLNDGDQVAVDLDATQTMTREYGWRPGVDQLLSVNLANGTAGVAVIDLQLGATVEGLINVQNGAGLADYKNTAWGKPNDTEGLTLRYRMAGREYDYVTGLYYMRARYYDPQSGRFMSEDPIGIGGGLNLYSYAGNDPLNLRDISGTSIDCETVHVGWHDETIVTRDGWGVKSTKVWQTICSGLPDLPPVSSDITSVGYSSNGATTVGFIPGIDKAVQCNALGWGVAGAGVVDFMKVWAVGRAVNAVGHASANYFLASAQTLGPVMRGGTAIALTAGGATVPLMHASTRLRAEAADALRVSTVAVGQAAQELAGAILGSGTEPGDPADLLATDDALAWWRDAGCGDL